MINYIIGGIVTGVVIFILGLLVYLLIKIVDLNLVIKNIMEDIIYLNNQNIELEDKYNNLAKPKYEPRLYEEYNNQKGMNEDEY